MCGSRARAWRGGLLDEGIGQYLGINRLYEWRSHFLFFSMLWTFARRWGIILSHNVKDGFESDDKAVYVGSSDYPRYYLQRLAG